MQNTDYEAQRDQDRRKRFGFCANQQLGDARATPHRSYPSGRSTERAADGNRERSKSKGRKTRERRGKSRKQRTHCSCIVEPVISNGFAIIELKPPSKEKAPVSAKRAQREWKHTRHYSTTQKRSGLVPKSSQLIIIYKCRNIWKNNPTGHEQVTAPMRSASQACPC